ncbi:hypothetical protein QBC47DRAFT_291844 [Echria macrotheca]|uniref:Uncharacterized protein n=1 Tax=Echria macrotheca TaxID=438768 RepID=A0AAJ0F923_9PEZI|nr:hypothetical protein QBC47DRAFT_291844 [Echria macrotheca]
MDNVSRMSDMDADMGDVAVVEECKLASGLTLEGKSPLTKTRSLSDGGGTPNKLSPSPHIFEVKRQQSKDDIGIRDNKPETQPRLPSTPIRAGFSMRGLSLQMPREAEAVSQAEPPSYVQPAPLSPKLDHSHIYASPTNILPRRSRGLDFSRAATSLHHSTLADQSPDSSPTIGSRAMNIPGRREGGFGAAEQSNSLWSMMGNSEKMHISSSLGSNHHLLSDSSSSSELDDDLMDEEMDDAYVTTPQVVKSSAPIGLSNSTPWMPSGSPAVNSLASFQQRQRQRKQPRKQRGLFGLGFHSTTAGGLSKSPPGNLALPKEMTSSHHRRESISWAANQLHISGNDSDDNRQADGTESPSRPNVVRRAVTRPRNLLPKTKGFARIRAALAEESAPADAEFRREAEVVRQVRESDPDLETRLANAQTTDSAVPATLSSPKMSGYDLLNELTDDMMMMDSSSSGNGNGDSFGLMPKDIHMRSRQTVQDLRDKMLLENLENLVAAASRVTPPPPTFLTRASSSAISTDDMSMDSPSTVSGGNPFLLPGALTGTSSSGADTPQPQSLGNQSGVNGSGGISTSGLPSSAEIIPATSVHGSPSVSEMTWRVNSKRRRDDDLDPVAFKRRAVSPGMSVHNSPIMQSPLQRDTVPWAAGSRPGSVGGDTTGKPGGSSGAPSENGSGTGGNGGRPAGTKVRVGFQGMVDTNDGITRLSIE